MKHQNKPGKDTDDGSQQHWYGAEAVDGSEKRRRVKELFTEVADRYDLMNDLMSFGMHRLWKRFMIHLARLRPEHRVLELAAGSADLAQIIVNSMDEAPSILVTDINHAMLKKGRERLIDRGHLLPFAQIDGENLPACDAAFDRVLISFGLRNVTDQEKCLREILRVLKPSGFALIMEFSMDLPETLTPLYDAYSLQWLPRLGRWVGDNEAGYRYLAESIRKQMRSQEMCELIKEIGFARVHTNKLAFGAVTIYRAYS